MNFIFSLATSPSFGDVTSAVCPGWEGKGAFERVIGLMKSAFYKTVSQGILNCEELSEVILDIEVTMTNRPLCYQEDDVQLPTMTPNTMLFLKSNILPSGRKRFEEARQIPTEN